MAGTCLAIDLMSFFESNGSSFVVVLLVDRKAWYTYSIFFSCSVRYASLDQPSWFESEVPNCFLVSLTKILNVGFSSFSIFANCCIVVTDGFLLLFSLALAVAWSVWSGFVAGLFAVLCIASSDAEQSLWGWV